MNERDKAAANVSFAPALAGEHDFAVNVNQLSGHLYALGLAIKAGDPNTDVLFSAVQVSLDECVQTSAMLELKQCFALNSLELKLIALTFVNTLEPETLTPFLGLSWFDHGANLSLERALLLCQADSDQPDATADNPASKAADLHRLLNSMKVFRWQILSISDHALPLIQPLMLAADIFAHLLASQHTLARTPEIIPTLVPQHDAVIAACFDAQLKQPLRQVNMLTGLDADDRSALVAQFASDLERPWHYVAPKLRHNASSCEVIRAFRQMLLRANLQTCYIYWPDLLSDILEQGSSDGLLALLFCANHTPADNQTSAIAPPIILFCDQALNDSDGSALHWLDSTLLDNLWSSVCFAQPIEPLTLHLTQPKLEQISRGWLALSARLLANTVANSPCFIRGLSAANAVYLANLYPLSATTMSRVGVKIAKVLARSQGHVSLFELLQQACLQANSEISGQLASLSQPRYQLSDMILDDHTQEQLQELIDRLVYRAQLTQAMPHFVAGIQALFWGKPGTGKSMAAEAIAGQLKLPLYKVNLANVASKWIGESEKHLAQLFDNAQKQNAVLLFDEADAIFAKRSEVESSHDKNANMGVSFLLQRMESYTGLLLLSTNFKSNLDDAFLRRFHGVVEFVMPDADLRLQLWQKAWSGSTLLAADIDLQSLAEQFEFTPSQINNIAERALLFTIKAQQKTISKALLGKAVTREFEKQNAGFLSEQKLTRWLALN